MDEKKKRLFENIFSQGTLQIVNYVIPLIVLPYQVRVIGVEKYGLLAFAMSLITYFSIFVDFGFYMSATRDVSKNRHNTNSVSNVFNSVMIAKFLLMLISFIILLVLIAFVPIFRKDWLVFILSFTFLVGNTIYPTWFFVGQERAKYITILSVIAKLIFLVLLFVFVRKQSDYILIPLLNGLGTVIAGVTGLVYAIRKFDLKLYVPRFSTICKHYKESSQFFFASVAAAIYSNTNVFCLGLLSSNLVVGYYSAAEKVLNAIFGLRFPVDISLFPYMVKNKDIPFFKKFILIAISINTAVCLLIMGIFAKQTISLVFGTQMLPAYRILQIFCFTAIVEFISYSVGYLLLVVYKHETQANLSIFITSAFHLIGLFILFITNNINMYSVAIMMTTSLFVTFLFRMYYINKFKVLRGTTSSN